MDNGGTKTNGQKKKVEMYKALQPKGDTDYRCQEKNEEEDLHALKIAWMH